MGFGVDAHSMLIAAPELRAEEVNVVRFATPDSLEAYQQPSAVSHQPSDGRQLKSSRILVDKQAALEESFFLGLRLNGGVSLARLRSDFGEMALDSYAAVIGDLLDLELLGRQGDHIRLTSRGRLLSNEVFARFLRSNEAQATHLPA
jgi:oxygen-independent coproporphyrinogen-3 oxidase